MDAIKNFANSISNRDNTQKPPDGQNKVLPVDEQEQPLKTNNAFSSLANGLQAIANSSVQKAKDQIQSAQNEVKQGFGKLDDKLKSMLKQYSIQINVWARAKVIDSIIHILEQFRPIAKDGLKDPDMCQCVKNLVDDSVDAVWPELMDEVKYELMLTLQEPYTELEDKKVIACLYPFVCWRNWYLYATQPFDRSIWKQMKTISWWFWTLVSAVPFYGVSQFFYVYDFLNIDKEDEYQLVQFILSFKAMFFITQGVMKALIGYFVLYACSTEFYKSDSLKDSCIRKGPGSSIEAFSEVVGQFCQVFFIWLAFLLLPCSKQKGRPVFLYQERPQESEGCFSRGGRLKYFMAYDLFALGASIGLFWLVYLLIADGKPDFDGSGDFIYFSEICYGLLSFPFLLFSLPFIKGRLTLAKPTAYDRKGNCIPSVSGVKHQKKIETEKMEQQTLLNSITLDVSEVFDG